MIEYYKIIAEKHSIIIGLYNKRTMKFNEILLLKNNGMIRCHNNDKNNKLQSY